ncbi:MAG: sulfatase [bacterium]
MTNEKYFVNALKALVATAVSLWVLDVIVNFSLVQELYLKHPLQAGVKDFFGLLIFDLQIAAVVVAGCWIVAGAASLLLKAGNKTNHAVILLSSTVIALTSYMTVKNAFSFAQLHPIAAVIVGLAVGTAAWIVLHFKVRDVTDRGTTGEILQAVLYPAMIVGIGGQVFARLIDGRIEAAVLNAVVAALAIAALTALIVFRWGFVRFVLRWLPVLVAVILAGHAIGSSARYGDNPDTIYRDPTHKRPTIVLIVLDTVRADHLKRFGYARDTMPALEKWAEKTVTFTRAASPAGWTGPAHASIFSGLPVSLHGHHYGISKGVFATHVVDGIRWLPAQIASKGYYCVGVSANPLAVKFADMGFERLFEPTRRPWDRMSLAGEADYHFSLLRRLSERLRWRISYADAACISRIVPRAVPEGDGPVFLFVNFLDAHSPYNPPEAALEQLGVRPARSFHRYDSHRALTLHWRNLPQTAGRSLNELYDGELRWIDVNLRGLLEWIDERYGDDAFVIVTSDHGEELGEHGRVGHEYGLSQALVHVPLFIKGPNLEPGEFTSVMSTRSLHDFILSLASGDTPDLTAFAEPDSFGVLAERYPSGHAIQISLGTGYDRPWVALFEDGLKAIGPSQYGSELFDVEVNGFHNETPLTGEAAVDTTAAGALFGRIDTYWDRFRDRREASEFAETSEEMRKNLRSLGYIK